MTARSARFNWTRVAVAAIAAEALPVLALVLVVLVYGVTRRPGSPSPEQFAPAAGLWVGPFGGFLATLWLAFRTARRSPERPMAHGAAVGLGAALLDLALAGLLGGGVPVDPVLFLSNGGRLLAGALGGRLALRAGVLKDN